MKKRQDTVTDILKKNYFLFILIISLVFVSGLQSCQPTISSGNCCQIKDEAGVVQACVAGSVSEDECSTRAGGVGFYNFIPSSSCLNFQRNPDCGVDETNNKIGCYIDDGSGVNKFYAQANPLESPQPGALGCEYGGKKLYKCDQGRAVLVEDCAATGKICSGGICKDQGICPDSNYDFDKFKGPLQYYDDFSGDVIDSNKWNIASNDDKFSVYVQGGKLVMSKLESDVEGYHWTNINSNNKFLLSGDFDVQVDFNLINLPAGDASSANQFSLQVKDSATSALWTVNRVKGWNLNGYITWRTDIKSGWGQQSTTGTDTGKLRLERTNNYIQAFRWIPSTSQWSSIGGTSITTGPVYILVALQNDGRKDALNVEVDNLIVDEKTINSSKWSFDPTFYSIGNDKLKVNIPAGLGENRVITSIDKIMLGGDFDIKVDYDISDIKVFDPEQNGWHIIFQATGVDNRLVGIKRSYYGQHKYFAGYNDGSGWIWDDIDGNGDFGVMNTDLSGRLRLKRNNGKIYAYYWNSLNYRWEYQNDANGYMVTDQLTGPVSIQIGAGNTNTKPNVIAYFDNFASGCLPGTALLVEPVNVGDTNIIVDGDEGYTWSIGDIIYIGSSIQPYNITSITVRNSPQNIGIIPPAVISAPAGTTSGKFPPKCFDTPGVFCIAGTSFIDPNKMTHGDCIPPTTSVLICGGEEKVISNEACESCVPDIGCVKTAPDKCYDSENKEYLPSQNQNEGMCFVDGKRDATEGRNCVSWRCYDKARCQTYGKRETAFWGLRNTASITPGYKPACSSNNACYYYG